jgi:hypothetical protein
MAKKKAKQTKMSRSQKIMAVVGVFVILSMVIGSIASLLTQF